MVWQALLVHKQHAQQLLIIKRGEVNAAQVLAFPLAVQGVVQRDGGRRVDVKVAEKGAARHIIARSAAVLQNSVTLRLVLLVLSPLLVLRSHRCRRASTPQ